MKYSQEELDEKFRELYDIHLSEIGYNSEYHSDSEKDILMESLQEILSV